MRRLIIPSLLVLTFLLSACGPGLLLGAGGTIGVILGLDSEDEKKKDTPPPPTTNVIPAVVVTSVAREESPCSISYTIIDANVDLCAVEVEYNVGSGFSTCTEGAGGDGLMNLASSAGGTAHVFSWDYLTDEDPGANTNISVRIRADDGQGFGSWFTLGSQSIGNDAPTITNVVTTGSGNVVLVTFDFSDVSGDVGFVNTAYSIDQGANFIDVAPAEFVGNPPSSIASSPSGSPGQFIWDSSQALPDYVGEVLLRLVPADMPSGFSGITLGPPLVVGPASVDNSVNGPPEVGFATILDAATFTGEVEVDFDLLDEESDASLLAVEYSEDGTSWFDATLLQQITAGVVGPFFTSPAPSLYSFTWDALADLGDSAAHTMKLRIAGHDGQTGSIVESDWFTVIGNEAPQVSAIEIFQNSANITVSFDIWDENFDPVSLDIEYSIDGGASFLTILSGDWILGDPASVDSSPVGEGNVLIWDTISTLGIANYAGVILRATPTDTPSSAPSAGLSGTTFDSAPFPVVNDAGGTDPISIDIYTTAANSLSPDTVNRLTVPLAGSIGLGAIVNPSSALEQNTYWGISETGADYGSMSSNSSSTGISQAQGSFDVAAFGSIVDGDIFTIDDGIQGSQAFEFDSDSITTVGNTPILMPTSAPWTSNDQAAIAIATAINNHSLVAINAFASTNTINLTHSIGCRVSNTGGAPGNAADITFSNGMPFANIIQMGYSTAGKGDEYITYTAPASAPAGSDHVTIFCAIDHPSFQYTVTQIYEIYFGAAPTAVSITPSSASILTGEQQQFTSAVLPASAPQIVWWEVDGGATNGTIDQTGFYIAPSVLPASNLVTIKAYSIDDLVIGTAVVNLIPEPTSIVVSPTTSSIAEINVGNQTEQFNALVNPTAAPQTVTWRIFWDGNNMGSGNLATVGTISGAGVYTSPSTQPIPDIIFIEAVSTVRPAVFGSYQLKLKALVPTSFALAPNSVTLTAGGVGQQFAVSNFLPAGANEAVVWSIDPVIGSVSSSGFYTPPTTLLSQRVIVLRAESAIASGIFQTASITVNPPTGAPPVSISLTPADAMTFSAGERIQFSHVVSPSGASQSVNWSVTSGGGSIDSLGLYSPAYTAIDKTVTVRCESAIDTSIFRTASIIVDGNGNTNKGRLHEVVSRTDHAGLHHLNAGTEEIWYVGGKSPVSGSEFSTEVRVHNISQKTWHVSKSVGNGSITTPIVNISSCIDDLGVIWAVVGYGGASDSEVWSYDTINSGMTGSWKLVDNSGPNLTNLSRYKLFAYPCAGPGSGTQLTPTHLMLLKDGKKALPFKLSNKDWQGEEDIKNGVQKPKDITVVGGVYAKDATAPRLWFAGPDDNISSAPIRTWRLDIQDKSPDAPELTWKRHKQSGQPSDAIFNPALTWDAANSKIILFGGYEGASKSYLQNFWEISVSTAPEIASWSLSVPSFLAPTSPTGPELAYPQPRSYASIVMNISEDTVYLYGGSNRSGKFGDIWSFSYPGNFIPDQQQTTSILPAGRESPAAAIDDSGVIWVYGGLCDSGPSNELWRLQNYNPASGDGDWVLEHAEAQAIGDKPPALLGASFEYDSKNQVFYLLGGATNSPMTNYNADVYKYDPASGRWTKHSPSGGPGGLAGIATYYSSTNSAIAAFGGSNSGGTNKTNSFFALDISGSVLVWSTLGNSGDRPSNREYATLGYDSVRDQIYLLGGDDGAGGQQQLFVWDTGQWTLLPVLNGASANDVSRSGGAWDEANLRFFNAPSSKKQYQSVTMTSNGSSWHYLIAPTTNNTTGSVGIFDPNLGYYICMFGKKLVNGIQAGINVTRSFMVK